MNEHNLSCHVIDPTGSWFAIPVGIVITTVLTMILDYFFVDIASGAASLEWVRQLLGLLSHNELPAADDAWLYTIIITSSFITGMISLKWYKAVLSATLIPIFAGIAYSLIGLSMGYGMVLSEFFITPFFFSLWYVIPAVIASLITSSILSQKAAVGSSRNIISGIR